MAVVDIVRKSAKGTILKRAKHLGADFTFKIDAIPGKPEFINLLVRNSFPTEELFQVHY